MQTKNVSKKILKTLAEMRAGNFIDDYGHPISFLSVFEPFLQEHGNYSVNFSNEFILELHQLITKAKRDWSLGDIWSTIVKLNANPLPTEVALEAMENEPNSHYLLDSLANSFQELPVYYAAADRSKHARSRLCLRLFLEEKYSTTEFNVFIKRYGKEGALRVLKARKPSSNEKLACFSQEEIDSLQQEFDPKMTANQKKRKRKNMKLSRYLEERKTEEKRIKGKD